MIFAKAMTGVALMSHRSLIEDADERNMKVVSSADLKSCMVCMGFRAYFTL